MMKRTNTPSEKMALQIIIKGVLESKFKMTTNEFISNLKNKRVDVLFNKASTGYVSGISYSYNGMIITGGKLALLPVRDALDVISGKWKLLILISILAGNHRFREIERSIPNITPKVLANELKDLEEHRLIKRTVYDDAPVVIEYTVTPYANSLKNVIKALRDWGNNHRKIIMGK